MRTISGLLQIIGLLVIAIGGYWIWFANWGPNQNDRISSTVVMLLPPAAKDWGCGKLNQRFGAQAPTFCSPVAGGPAPTTPPSTTPEGGGRL